MQTIAFASTAIDWPPLCACCLGAPSGRLLLSRDQTEHYLVAKKTSTITVEVPYCAECMRHVTWYQETPVWVKAFLVFLISGLIGVLVGLGLFVVTAPRLAAALSLGTPFLATGVFLWRKLPKRPGRLGEGHAARDTAVQIGYFSDEELRLSFLNDSFAEAVRELNDV